MSSRLYLIMFGLASLLLCFSVGADDRTAQMYLQGLRVPIKDDDGNVDREIKGESATVFTNGSIYFEGVELRYLDEAERMLIETESCLYQIEKRLVTSKKSIRLERDNMLIKGAQFAVSGRRQRVRIERDVYAEIVDARSFVSSNSASGDMVGTGLVTVVAGTMDYDYDSAWARLGSGVVVTDSDMRVAAETMDMQFGPDNTITSLVAESNVEIVRGVTTAVCRSAQCDLVGGVLVLSGDPKVRSPGKVDLEGDQIVWMRELDKFYVRAPGHLLLYDVESFDEF